MQRSVFAPVSAIGLSTCYARARALAFAVLAVLSMNACNTASRPPPAQSSTPSTYSVAVSVSGLQGSGLALIVNGGAPLLVGNNGSITVASNLASGASYSVAIDSQPVNPVQTCTVTGGSGTLSSTNTTVFIACAAGGATTVNAAKATVAIDPSTPSSATSLIKSIVSPLDSQSSGSPLYIPVSGNAAGESMVFAVDAKNNILLAALTTTTSVTLSADSTALALTRLEIGVLRPSISGVQLNDAIKATPDYQNLLSLVSTALVAGTSPASSTDVFASINAVLGELPSTVLAALSQAPRANVRAQGQPVATPQITPDSLPYPLLNTYAAGASIGSVSVTGATNAGGVSVANTTAITWAVASATTDRSPLPAGCATSETNPDCSVLVGPTGLFKYVIGTKSTVTLPGNADAFNVYIEQTTASRTANVIETGKDTVGLILNIATAGAEAPLTQCVGSIIDTFLPAEQVAELVTEPSGSAVIAYVQSFFSPTGTFSLWKSYNEC